ETHGPHAETNASSGSPKSRTSAQNTRDNQRLPDIIGHGWKPLQPISDDGFIVAKSSRWVQAVLVRPAPASPDN
ncbi:MAG: hypothetical protein ABGZ17_22325, partial [Planctomycetaceae bacterium]